MKKNDKGMGELLGLLKARPELVDALVFNPKSVKRLLESKAARRLIMGADTRTFLRYVGAAGDGGPIAQCLKGTALACTGGTKIVLPCLSGTKKPCVSGTRPPTTRLPGCKP